MLIQRNSTSGLVSVVPRPVSVAAPAILLTSSHYPTPAALSRRSSGSMFVRPAFAKSFAREVTRPTTKPPRSWSRSRAQPAQNRNRSGMFQYTRRGLIGREYITFHPSVLCVLIHGFPSFSVPRVASSSAATGKHWHLAFVSRSSAHKGGSDGNSMHDADTTLSSSTTHMVNRL